VHWRGVKAMRLVGASVVRDEEDIIDAFVRHNLAFLCHLHIVAHRCGDRTETILHSLRQDRFPISIIRQEDAALRKADWLNELAARSFSQGADVVVPLDADEFVKIADRKGLPGRLSAIPESLHPAWRWQSYVPTLETLSHAGAAPVDVLQQARHRLKRERSMVPKVLLRRDAARSGWRIDEGAHCLVGVDMTSRLALMTHCWLAHFPVRSSAQFERKIRHGQNVRSTYRPTPSTRAHWLHPYERIFRSGAATAENAEADCRRLATVRRGLGVLRR
jgi:Glycosyl transferase family 2